MNSSPRCRFCAAPLTTTLVDLGTMPLANSFVTPEEAAHERRFPLQVRVCSSCFLVQASDSLSPDAIFSDYVYFSSYSDSWVEHARRFAEAAVTRYGLTSRSLVVEVASNDGYLLQHFARKGVPVLGIEPAANVAQTARAKGITTEVTLFGTDTARRIAAQKGLADLIVANNVLAHVPDIRDFVSGFAILLKPEGVASFEVPHVLNLLRQVQFDTIYHEHFSYLSLLAIERVFSATAMKAIDVEEIPTHGGSLRVYAARQDSARSPSRNLDALRAREHDARLDRLEGYSDFGARVDAIKADFLGFLAQAKSGGRKIAAYGAAAKGNTFLNYCGVSNEDIVCVFDRSAAKQNKLLPGSHIPVLAPERLADIKPDYLVILPWNIADEIRAQNRALSTWGGKFVTAIPQLRIHP
jgi:2-polyprenyl-3-methyl-5-hydroxy-6-metoxy-1,4-benzoquinol methylase